MYNFFDTDSNLLMDFIFITNALELHTFFCPLATYSVTAIQTIIHKAIQQGIKNMHFIFLNKTKKKKNECLKKYHALVF